MKALIDGDILRYEVGFAAETGWQTEGEVPPWDYVQSLLDQRIENILAEAKANTYNIYLSGKNNFRKDVAVTKVYKGTRKENKPHHFDNLTAYIRGMPQVVETDGIEADDAMAIEQVQSSSNYTFEGLETDEIVHKTIICSRDKDLRQVPGWHFGWELGNQPSFGPELVDHLGYITLDTGKKPPKLKGTGFKFFCSQLITGDTVDNVPGLPKAGPVLAYNLLHDAHSAQECMGRVYNKYGEFKKDKWQEYLLEQGRLLWLVRGYNEDGSPRMWNIGDFE